MLAGGRDVDGQIVGELGMHEVHTRSLSTRNVDAGPDPMRSQVVADHRERLSR